jgi:hypothetical protein
LGQFGLNGQESGYTWLSWLGMGKKVVCAVELTESGKVKRFYTLKINDFYAKCLVPFFEDPIGKKFGVIKDEWKGNRSTCWEFNIR